MTAPAVWFAYSPDRKGERPKLHLKDYRGALQADAYAGFNHLYEGGTIYEVACWAHARRKFHEIHIAHASPVTSEAIERIAALYAIEAEIRGSTADVRKAVRQTRSRPLLDSMKTWLDATLAKLSRKSDTAAAIRYALSRWKALTRYVDNGQLEIDNNAAERALRVIALGRKNFLFAGSDAGGHLLAARNRQAQRPRPGALSPPRPRTHRRPPRLQHQRPAALERSDPHSRWPRLTYVST
jgi:hypothetical protein